MTSLSGVTRNWGDPPAKIIQKPNGCCIENAQGFNGYWFKHVSSNNARILYLLASGRHFCCRPCLTGSFSDIMTLPEGRILWHPSTTTCRFTTERVWDHLVSSRQTGTARWALWWWEHRQRQSYEQSSRWGHDGHYYYYYYYSLLFLIIDSHFCGFRGRVLLLHTEGIGKPM